MNIGHINEFKRAEAARKLARDAHRIDAAIAIFCLSLIAVYAIGGWMGWPL